MVDHSGMKLGRKRAVVHPSVPMLAKLMVNNPLPATPQTISVDNLVTNWPMLANDQYGDCTIAGALHIAQLWYALSGNPIVPDDGAALSAYTAITGFDPNNPATDEGAVESTVLNYWRTTGLAVNSAASLDRIDGWATVPVRDVQQITTAIFLFGAVYAGVLLPISAQTQDTWTADPSNLEGDNAPGSWGGHCVPLVAYNAIGPMCVTWGALKQMTWTWWGCYAEEAHAVLSKDMLEASGVSGRGIAWDVLAKAMASLPTG
jgi:hypothetical protein